MDKLTGPSVNILGPVTESLKYNLDQEHIKNMFMNILVSDMNVDKKEKVLPAFVDIVKQLSTDDAKFLKTLKELSDGRKNDLSFHMLQIKLTVGTDKHYFVPLDKYIAKASGELIRIIKINQLILDNLTRLGLVGCNLKESISDFKTYESAFNDIKNNYGIVENEKAQFDYSKNILFITLFGEQFLSVCLD